MGVAVYMYISSRWYIMSGSGSVYIEWAVHNEWNSIIDWAVHNEWVCPC